MQGNNVFKLAEYLNIINALIEKYAFSSFFKTCMTSLILYYQVNSEMGVRKGSNNLFHDFFMNFHSILITNYSDFNYISQIMNINEKNGNISIENDKITKNRALKLVSDDAIKYMGKDNISEILNEIKNMSIYSFVQEVVENV